MKPLELKLKAFGSYVEETVRFEDMKHGLYLVTGDTGSGKTTLFDAIMFALYGKASGTDRDSAEMLHSDYVELSDDTVVTLRFLQGGRECTVTRSIHFTKKRGGSYGDPKVDAELIEPDRPALKGAKKVTGRVEALLGLNAEQFRKIIMLAQGEFKEFLKADSDRKGEILGKLFDSSPYQWFQKLLCGARDALKARRDGHRAELETQLRSVFRLPEGADPLLYAPEHPALPDNLRALIDGESTRLKALTEALEKAGTVVGNLYHLKGSAKVSNDLLDELKASQDHLAGLEAQREAYARRREVAERAERSLRGAMPAIGDFERAEADLKKTEDDIAKLNADIAAQRRALGEAQARVDADAPDRERLSGLNVRLENLKSQLPDYDKLEKDLQDHASALADASKAEAAEKQAREEQTQAEQALDALRKSLEAQEGIDARTVEAESRADQAGKRLEALKCLRQAVTDLLKQEKALEGEKRILAEQTQKAMKAHDLYDALYRRFIEGQAGLLAEALREQVNREGHAVCSVCGAAIQRADLARLAPLDAETPAKSAVDRARADHDKQEKARGEQDKVVNGLEEALKAGRQNAVDRAQPLIEGCDSWDRLCAPGTLDAAIAEARIEKEAADEAHADCKEQRDRRDADKARQPGLEAELRECGRKLEENRNLAEQHRRSASALEAKIDESRKHLEYADRAEAEIAQNKLTAERDALDAQLKDHQTALEQAQGRVDTSEGSMRVLQKTKGEQATRRDEARDAQSQALEQAGFPDPAAARAALEPIGSGDPEAWLKAEQRAQADYNNDIQNTGKRVRELTGQTQGLQRVDLEALQAQIDGAEAAQREAAAQQNACDSLLKNHREVREKAEAALRSLAASEAAWQRIDRLAAMAMGVSGADGKVSFERYALQTAFNEILDMANQRLTQMSGGRYELVLKPGANRANARAGLDLEVLDYVTGQRRPSGSLSGGESFFTSLSLALGLSDAVQSHAGGRQMDALFIDEGFGTLSEGYLDKALEVLNQLTEGSRLVGVISHVSKLDESIPQKLRVTVGERGSRVHPVL